MLNRFRAHRTEHKKRERKVLSESKSQNYTSKGMLRTIKSHFSSSPKVNSDTTKNINPHLPKQVRNGVLEAQKSSSSILGTSSSKKDEDATHTNSNQKVSIVSDSLKKVTNTSSSKGYFNRSKIKEQVEENLNQNNNISGVLEKYQEKQKRPEISTHHNSEHRRFAMIGKLTKNILGSFNILESMTGKIDENNEGSYVSIYERFVQNPENLNVISTSKLNSQLWNAVESGQSVAFVKQLIHDGSFPNMKDAMGNSILHLCGINDHHHLIRYFIGELQLSLDMVNNRGLNPVQYSPKDQTKLVFLEIDFQKLFEYTTKDNLVGFKATKARLEHFGVLDKLSLTVVLHVAAEHGSVRILQQLLETEVKDKGNQLSIDATTSKGLSALHYAVKGSQFHALRILLEHDADIFLKDPVGRLPEEMATTRTMQKAIQYCCQVRTTLSRYKDSEVVSAHSLQRMKRKTSNYFERQTKSRFLIDGIVLRSHSHDSSEIELLSFRDIYQGEKCGDEREELPSAEGAHPNNVVILSSSNEIDHFLSNALHDRGDVNVSYIDKIACELLSTESFCEELAATNASGPIITSFVLTNELGEKSYCFVLVFQTLSTHSKKTLCFYSKFPFLSFMAQWLAISFETFKESGSLEGVKSRQVKVLLDDMLSLQCNSSGDPVPVQVAQAGSAELGALREPRQNVPMWPGDISALPFVDDNCFRVVFSLLRADHVLQLLSALLTEQSVVILSSKLERLVPCCEALISMLFPFRWSHTYIPLLPARMLEILHAPSPFLIGLHSRNLEAIGGERLTSLVIVNLDVDSIVLPIDPSQNVSRGISVPNTVDNQVMHFPPAMQEKLLQTLEPACQRVVQKGMESRYPTNRALSNNVRLEFTPHYPPSHHDSRPSEEEAGADIKNQYPMQCTFNHEVETIRLTIAEALIKLIGPVIIRGCGDQAQRHVLGFLADWDTKLFLERIFSTVLYGCLAYELQHSSETLERELQIEAIQHKVDQILDLDQCRVQAQRVLLYREPDLSSAVVGYRSASETLTVAQCKQISGTKAQWFKVREAEGWCLLEMGKDAIWIRTKFGERVGEDTHDLQVFGNVYIYSSCYDLATSRHTFEK